MGGVVNNYRKQTEANLRVVNKRFSSKFVKCYPDRHTYENRSTECLKRDDKCGD